MANNTPITTKKDTMEFNGNNSTNKVNHITTNPLESHLPNLPHFAQYLNFFLHLTNAMPNAKRGNHDLSEEDDEWTASSKYWKHTSTENKQNIKFLRKTNQKLPDKSKDQGQEETEEYEEEEEEGEDDNVNSNDNDESEMSDELEEQEMGNGSLHNGHNIEEEESVKTNKSLKQKSENFVFSALKTDDIASASTTRTILKSSLKKRKDRPLSTEKLLKEKQRKKQKLIEQSDVNPEEAINQYAKEQLESAMIRSELGRDNKSTKVLQNKLKKERAKKKKSKKEWDQRLKNLKLQQQQKAEKRLNNIKNKKLRGKKDANGAPLVPNGAVLPANKKHRPGFEGKRAKVINGASKLKKLQQQSKQNQQNKS
jgi:hypothetical protein